MEKLNENTGDFAKDGEIENRILRTANTMFFNRGIKLAAMDDIAENVGVTRKILNHYFNRNELVNRVIFDHINSCKVNLSEVKNQHLQPLDEMKWILSITETFSINFSNIFLRDLKIHYREAWQALLAFSNGCIKDVIQENISRGIEVGTYRSQIKKDIVIDLYFSIVLLLMEKDYGTGGKLRMAEEVSEMNSNFLYML